MMNPRSAQEQVGSNAEGVNRAFDTTMLANINRVETISELTSGFFHDVNNVLGVLFGYLEMTLNECQNESTILPYLRQMERSADRVRDLVDQFHRLHSKRNDKPCRFNLVEECEKTLHLLSAIFPSHIIFEKKFPQWPLYLNDRVSQWRQVLINVLLNAKEAMPGGGVIRVFIQNVELAQLRAMGLEPSRTAETIENYALLVVEDEGLGMSPVVANRVFEPYFTTKEPSDGCGLGLTVAWDLIQRMGGAIHLVSEIGKGTSVMMAYPLTMGEGLTQAQKPALHII